MAALILLNTRDLTKLEKKIFYCAFLEREDTKATYLLILVR